MRYFSSHNQNGFVILFAVLISSMILLIGVGMFRISIKETILSSTARESTIAFFAADTGMECALYHQIKQGAFPSAIPAGTPSQSSSVDCNDQTPSITSSPGQQFVYEFALALDNTACTRVTVDRSNPASVFIQAQGFNICDGDEPDVENPLLLERVLEVRYQIGIQAPNFTSFTPTIISGSGNNTTIPSQMQGTGTTSPGRGQPGQASSFTTQQVSPPTTSSGSGGGGATIQSSPGSPSGLPTITP